MKRISLVIISALSDSTSLLCDIVALCLILGTRSQIQGEVLSKIKAACWLRCVLFPSGQKLMWELRRYNVQLFSGAQMHPPPVGLPGGYFWCWEDVWHCGENPPVLLHKLVANWTHVCVLLSDYNLVWNIEASRSVVGKSGRDLSIAMKLIKDKRWLCTQITPIRKMDRSLLGYSRKKSAKAVEVRSQVVCI